jgi:hypothetical protein
LDVRLNRFLDLDHRARGQGGRQGGELHSSWLRRQYRARKREEL